MTMNIPVADIQSLSPSALIELYELYLHGWESDATKIFRFHANTNELTGSVVWCGNTYVPFPVKAEGFQMTSAGKSARVKFQVANVRGVISVLMADGDESIVGSKVIRRRTFSKYLDAVNFASGINATADPTVEFVPDIFFVDRKSSETIAMVEFELAPAFDVIGINLPRRQIIQNCCTWKYRSAECGYTGANVADINDNKQNAVQDACGKRLTSCKIRFGATGTKVLPYGGFPAAGLVRM